MRVGSLLRVALVGIASLLVGAYVVLFLLTLPTGTDAPPFYATKDLSDQLPVFPGAEGFGTQTVAGRGGRVIRVTSLAADGPGSLRAALGESGPRVVVFEVGGIIETTEPLLIGEPYVTVAGQTAPPPGITIVGAGLIVHTHDVLLQHVRVRVGDRRAGPDPGGRDALAVYGAEGGFRDAYNVVIDHCSLTWAIDEGASTWNLGVHDVTFRQCIIAENLSRSLHPKGEHSKGLLLGDHARRVAVLGNLFAHNRERNPLIKGDVSALVVNNVIYNPGREAIHFSDPEGSGPSVATILGNVLIPGPDTRPYVPVVRGGWRVKRGTIVYVADNQGYAQGLLGAVLPGWSLRGLRVAAPPCWVRPLTIQPPEDVVEWVLANAGARSAERDHIDRRIIENVRARGGHIIDSPIEVGGYPPPRVSRRTVRLPDDHAADPDGDGYTLLDDWLHAAAQRVEATTE